MLRKLMFFFILSLSMQAVAKTGLIEINVHCLGGPSFDELLQSYSKTLKAADLKIINFSVTAKNGYGKACAGNVSYEPKATGRFVEYYRYEVNCILGSVFTEAQNHINNLKATNATVVSFQPESFNGYGKPCSAAIGFVRN